jgi:hypothetical protein
MRREQLDPRLPHRWGRPRDRHPARGLARPTREGPERQHAAIGGHPSFTGWCLDKEDLCVAKLCAHREKDLNVVAALLDHQLVDAAVIAERLDRLDAGHDRAAAPARVWMRARSAPDR